MFRQKKFKETPRAKDGTIIGRSTSASTTFAILVPNLFRAIKMAKGSPDTMFTKVTSMAMMYESSILDQNAFQGPAPAIASVAVPLATAIIAGRAINRQGRRTNTRKIVTLAVFLTATTGDLLRFLSKLGRTLRGAILILGAMSLVTAKTMSEVSIRIKLATTTADVRPKLRALLMNTVPFSNAPATTIVAPVSDSERAKANRKAASKPGLRMGKVTVRTAVKDDAPSVRAATS